MFSNSPRNIYIKLGLEKSLKESQLKKLERWEKGETKKLRNLKRDLL